ncbi:hypothetical protein OIU76_011515 [Salix suchowensis]|uniref:Uncharacterized protein n=1 Tax=Salix suchowensis TaxID=1278906 RepID=A0ABQ8ZXT9_9ROSI|nr:hypothetical protein OIU77_014348 [Salix suchowensis]KAJ6324224.1 hypothetical protein OIU76_011515 [Salix suchowensis]
MMEPLPSRGAVYCNVNSHGSGVDSSGKEDERRMWVQVCSRASSSAVCTQSHVLVSQSRLRPANLLLGRVHMEREVIRLY